MSTFDVSTPHAIGDAVKIDRRHVMNVFLASKRIPERLQSQAREAMEPLLVTLDKGSYRLAEREEVDEEQIMRVLCATTGRPVTSVTLLSMHEARSMFNERKAEARESFDGIGEMRRALNAKDKDPSAGNLPAQIWERTADPAPQELRMDVAGFLHGIGLSNGFGNNLRSQFGPELGDEMRSVVYACALGYLASICREQVAIADDFGSALDLVMTSYPMFQKLVPMDSWQILVA